MDLAPAFPSSGPAARAGAIRPIPCRACVRSLISGRSDGTCVSSGRGSRCERCSSGHSCQPIPRAAVAPARQLWELLGLAPPSRGPLASREALVKRRQKDARGLRARLRTLLDACEAEEERLAEEEEEEESSPSSSSVESGSEEEEGEEEDEAEPPAGGEESREELKERVKSGLCALVELLF